MFDKENPPRVIEVEGRRYVLVPSGGSDVNLMKEVGKNLIGLALWLAGNSVQQAARWLGMGRATLYRWMQADSNITAVAPVELALPQESDFSVGDEQA